VTRYAVAEMPKGTKSRVEELTEALALKRHPEGGAYAEHYRAGDDSCTAIYYLLADGAGSVWHQVRKDELWHHYEGEVVEIHVILTKRAAKGGSPYRVMRLGPVGHGRGAKPCVVVPAGAWQAARITARPGGPGHALVGCTIAPGFRFADWRLAELADLVKLAERAPEARKMLLSLAPKRG
jgi:predicted cupin superfamily sugar epimerase